MKHPGADNGEDIVNTTIAELALTLLFMFGLLFAVSQDGTGGADAPPPAPPDETGGTAPGGQSGGAPGGEQPGGIGAADPNGGGTIAGGTPPNPDPGNVETNGPGTGPGKYSCFWNSDGKPNALFIVEIYKDRFVVRKNGLTAEQEAFLNQNGLLDTVNTASARTHDKSALVNLYRTLHKPVGCEFYTHYRLAYLTPDMPGRLYYVLNQHAKLGFAARQSSVSNKEALSFIANLDRVNENDFETVQKTYERERRVRPELFVKQTP